MLRKYSRIIFAGTSGPRDNESLSVSDQNFELGQEVKIFHNFFCQNL